MAARSSPAARAERAPAQAAEVESAEIENRAPRQVNPFGDAEMDKALALNARVLWDSIGEVVVKAREGMAFIRSVASAVARKNKGLEGDTHGDAVRQEEWEEKALRVKTQPRALSA